MRHLNNIIIIVFFTVLCSGALIVVHYSNQGHKFEGNWSSALPSDESMDIGSLNIEVNQDSIVAFGQTIAVNFKSTDGESMTVQSGTQLFTFHRLSETTTRMDVQRLYVENAEVMSYELKINSLME